MHRRTKLATAALLFVIVGWLYIHTDRLPGSARKLEFQLAAAAQAAVAEADAADWARVDVRGRAAAVRGVAPAEEVRAEVLAAVRSAGRGGFAAVRDETDLMRRVEPYTFSARLDGERLTLSGYAPDRPTRDALTGRAARVFAGEIDATGVEIAAGAPPGADWLGAVDFGVSQLVRLRSGALELSDSVLTLEGETADAEVRADVVRQVLQAPHPFEGAANVRVRAPDAPDAPEPEAPRADDRPATATGSAARPPQTAAEPFGERAEADIDACRAEFASLLEREPMRFAFSEAEVSPASGPLLDALAATARRCEAFALAVEGHTDVSGEPAFNVYLSTDRAQAVRDALISRGVDPAQLVARGLGSSEPIADNSTFAGRARNRRIEMEVLGPREPQR